MVRKQNGFFAAAVGLLSVAALCTGQTGSTGSGKSAGKGSGSCAAVPNRIPTAAEYDLGQFLTTGPWYGYLAYSSEAQSATNPTDVNVVNYYTGLGKAVEATRDQQADIVIQEKRRYVNGSCMYLLEVGYFSADGIQFGPYFDYVNPQGDFTSEGNDASVIWSSDQSTYIMFFWCRTHNQQTGNCASTHINIYTRNKPTDMPDSQRQIINSAANAVLQPYCIDTSKFAQYTWDKNLPECPKAKYPDCFEHNVNSYTMLIDKKSASQGQTGKGSKARVAPNGSGIGKKKPTSIRNFNHTA